MQKRTLDKSRFLGVVFLLATAAFARVDPPLTTADVIRFLEVGISERTVLIELQDRGFWAPLDTTSETFLRYSGASDALIAAIRRVAPAPLPSPDSPRTADDKPRPGGIIQGPSFAAAARTVRVPVSVLDRYGRPAMGLTGPNFKVYENGTRQPVSLFSNERQPMRIALALDVSGSMENKIDQVEEALRYFIEILEPKDQIMVLTFGRQVHILQDFTSDREQLGRVLAQLQPAGATALYDAAYEAIRRVATGPAESKAVVLVTDGVNTGSANSFDDVLAAAQRAEVPIFSIGLDSGAPPTRSLSRPTPSGGGHGRPGGGGGGGWTGGGGRPGGGGPPPMRGRTGFDAKPLQELAEETGGRAEIVSGIEHYTPGEDLPGGAQLKQAVESIALTLRHRYLIGYEPPEGKPGWRKIRIDVDQPEGATTRSRKGYFGET